MDFKTPYLCALIILVLSGGCSDHPQDTLFRLRTGKETGITFNNRVMESDTFNILTEEYIFNGGGVAVSDFNNDGKPDLFFAGNQVNNALYLNEGGFKFKDISEEAGVGAPNKWSTGVAVVDINSDGWKDIYVCAALLPDPDSRKNMLFVNKGLNAAGIPVFEDQAASYGVESPQNSMNAAFFDYNKDGLLDLYVLNNEQNEILPTNYRKRINDGSAQSNDRLYRNNGNGTFSDVTMEAGIHYEGFGLGLAIGDFNQDDWPDIFVSNDYLTNDLMYINRGDGTFANEIEGRIRHQSKFSMGSDIADFNNDGYLDIFTLDMLGDSNYRMKTTISENNYIYYVLNERWEYEYQYMRNMLQLGNGPDMPMSEIGLMAGVYKTDWSWSPLFVDVDHDGARDLLVTNGFPRDITDRDFSDFRLNAGPYTSPGDILDSIPVVKIPNYAFRNSGNWSFTDQSEEWGLNLPSFSNGAIYADLDGDGDMDYVVSNINQEPFVFENTKAVARDFLLIDLKGSGPNPQGIGAKLVLRTGDGNFQYYEHYLNRGYMSSMDQPAHFGLGKVNGDLSLEVLWPDGHYQKASGPWPNGRVTLRHADARLLREDSLEFPLVPKQTKKVFQAVSNTMGLNFLHQENDVVDYNLQRTLPHKLSQFGPCMARGDIDGNGTEDLIIGSSAGYSPMLFLQNPDGRFTSREMFVSESEQAFEEEGMVLFDLENDGDLDLYLVSGSNEFLEPEKRHRDRLYRNDGHGRFSEYRDGMPEIISNGSVVRAMDYDADGFTDLFVGGRSPQGSYPNPDNSFLLRNTGGKLYDVTHQDAPGLSKPGMISDASWTDLNSDGRPDLVLTGEFMHVKVFWNTSEGFQEAQATGLEEYPGWWRSILTHDFDQDGDPDLVLGNLGKNNFYHPSSQTPVVLVAKDFDRNGSVDPIVFAYFKNEAGEEESYPVNFWGDIAKQSPIFRAKYNSFKGYARATRENLLTDAEREGAMELLAVYDQSAYAENLGDGTFRLQALPKEAQIAPVNDMVILDYDGDGLTDILLVGNDYGNETFIGRYDAFNGLLMRGMGNGKFKAVDARESGFIVPGDARRLMRLERATGSTIYIATQNRDSIRVFETLPWSK